MAPRAYNKSPSSSIVTRRSLIWVRDIIHAMTLSSSRRLRVCAGFGDHHSQAHTPFGDAAKLRLHLGSILAGQFQLRLGGPPNGGELALHQERRDRVSDREGMTPLS